MKKLLIAAITVVLSLSMYGCANCSKQENKPENIDSAQTVNKDDVLKNNYSDNLDGLVQFLKDMNYLPKNTSPTEMLHETIGAKKGVKYHFTVDNNSTFVELYEYDLNELDENAIRVRDEVRAKGTFHLFGKDGLDKGGDKDVVYAAEISNGGDGKYLTLYSGGERSKEMRALVDEFENRFKGTEASKTEASASEVSKTEASASEISKTEASASEVSKTEASKIDTSAP